VAVSIRRGQEEHAATLNEGTVIAGKGGMEGHLRKAVGDTPVVELIMQSARAFVIHGLPPGVPDPFTRPRLACPPGTRTCHRPD
jgi:hypothetical protein